MMTSTASGPSPSDSSPVTLASSSGDLDDRRRSQVLRFFLTLALTFLGMTIGMLLLLTLGGDDSVWVGRACIALMFLPSLVMIAMGIFMRDLGPAATARAA